MHAVPILAGDVWHIALPGCDSGLLYGYRVSGPNQSKNNAPSAAGHKFDEVSAVLAATCWKAAAWQAGHPATTRPMLQQSCKNNTSNVQHMVVTCVQPRTHYY